MTLDLGTIFQGRCGAGGGAHAIHRLGLPTNHNDIILALHFELHLSCTLASHQ
jgi:hypothetical protein